ncbi:MAG: amidohydrolase family protein, partial [Myxococcota bacterium]
MTLLPGLIDAHAHTFGSALPDAVRFGVTTVLDMFTTEDFASAERAKRATFADVAQADLFSSGILATSDGGHGTEYGIAIPTVGEAGQASAWVDERVAAGADYIKIVYIHPSRAKRVTSIDAATLRALIDAAHARQKLTIVHVQDVPSAIDAVDAGADGLAHTLLDSFAPPSLLTRMAERKTFVLSTLSVMSNLDRPRRARLPVTLTDRLSGTQRGTYLAPWPGTHQPELYANAVANVRQFRHHSIPVLAGSDAPNPGTAHGISLLAELQLLVDAGFTAQEALAAATRLPAEVFALDGRGRLKPGARADMVLVRGDPTRDISRVLEIERVWKNGYAVAIAPKKPKSVGIGAMSVSDFNANLNSAWGVSWSASSDAMMGGKSEASVAQAEGKSGKGMAIRGTIRPGFVAPWSGAFVPFAADWSRLKNLSAVKSVSFDVRGTPGTYRLMFFGEAQNARPVETTFEVKEGWSRTSVPLASVPGLDPPAEMPKARTA